MHWDGLATIRFNGENGRCGSVDGFVAFVASSSHPSQAMAEMSDIR